MSRKQLHVGTETLSGLQVFLKLTDEKKADLIRWHKKACTQHDQLHNRYLPKTRSKMREREKSEPST